MPIEKLSEVERAILANQCHILAALSDDARDRSRYKMQADVLERGLEGQYYRVFERIRSKTISQEVTDETFQILDMFRHIKWSIDKLPEEQRSQLDLTKLTFRGFDRTQQHYHYLVWWDARVEDNNYKEEIGDVAGLDAPDTNTLAEYRAMLEVHKTLQLHTPYRPIPFDRLKDIQSAIPLAIDEQQ